MFRVVLAGLVCPGMLLRCPRQEIRMIECFRTDDQGRRLHSSGTWNGGTTLRVPGGQGMHFRVKNANVLGTLITIQSQDGATERRIVPPLGTVDISFSSFGNEPMGWTIEISTESAVF